MVRAKGCGFNKAVRSGRIKGKQMLTLAWSVSVVVVVVGWDSSAFGPTIAKEEIRLMFRFV